MSGINWLAVQAKFAPDELEFRVQQSGIKDSRVWAIVVPYVTNRAIQARLDAVVGPGNWQNEFRPGPDGGVMCGLSLRVDGEWITKWDGAENTEIEKIKGGFSGSMKRAAVQWGIGRYLYALDETFANVHQNGRFRGKVKGKGPGDDKPFRWDPPALPAWALPDGTPQPQAERVPEAQASDPRRLAYIRTVGPMVPEDAKIKAGGKMHNLRAYVREHWETIKERDDAAQAVVKVVEKATGISFDSPWDAEPAESGPDPEEAFRDS